VESAVRGTAEQRSIKAGPLIHATRVALTGRTTSPGLFELIVLLGREESVARPERLAEFLLASQLSRIPEENP
jgi:glutamyl-tRNA synthetase